MSLPTLVLVHGGIHAADCWERTVAEINRLEPDLRVLAVDLPGRAGKPGDLATLTPRGAAESVVADIEAAGLDEIVIVGHSMAGVTVPGVVAKLGASRVREMVLATAFVPRQGNAIIDTLSGFFAPIARFAAKGGKPFNVPRAAASIGFCNGMTREQRNFTLSRIYRESVLLVSEDVDRSDLPPDVPRTWILTLRDRALSLRSQLASIDAIGGVQTMIQLDTCHDLMVSEPKQLAEILIERCRLRSS
jgi:pimeloyl-ACP methyl ester carboxylesterase